MNRRRFLRIVPAAAGATALAGCSGGGLPTYRITETKGFEESKIFDSYEFDSEEDSLTVYLTEDATLNHGIEEVDDLLYCGKGDSEPQGGEFELEPGQTELGYMGFQNCMEQYEVGKRLLVAYDDMDSQVDHVKFEFEQKSEGGKS